MNTIITQTLTETQTDMPHAQTSHTSDEKVSEQNLLAKLISFLFYKGSRENRLSFFYAYEQKGAPNHDKAKRENPRGAASRD